MTENGTFLGQKVSPLVVEFYSSWKLFFTRERSSKGLLFTLLFFFLLLLFLLFLLLLG
jgi:hypothetical protein